MINSLVYYLLGILFIIQIRGDGYFPFPKSWSPDGLMAIVLVHTILLVFFICRASQILITGKGNKIILFRSQKILPVTTLKIIPVLLLITICGFHILQSHYFRNIGYRMNWNILSLFFIFSLIPVITFWYISKVRKRVSYNYFLHCILASAVILQLVPILLFPITAKRSDMLPILKSAAISLWHGENPYQYYLLDNGVMTQNVRFPGLILAYLPPAILDWDLRWITLLFELLTMLLLFKITKDVLKVASESNPACWDIPLTVTCFLLLPYFHYRHELYETPFWFFTLVTLIALYKKHFIGFTLGLIGMMVMHQWGWLFAPFILIGFSLNCGLKKTLGSLSLALLLSGIIISLVIKFHYREFYEQTLQYYDKLALKNEFYPMSMYFSAYFAKFNITRFLRPVQVLFQIPLLYLAYRYGKRIDSLCGILALSLTFMLLFNPVAWTYQYLLVVFLLILGLCFRDTQQNIATDIL